MLMSATALVIESFFFIFLIWILWMVVKSLKGIDASLKEITRNPQPKI